MEDYCEECRAFRIVKHGLCKRCRMQGPAREIAEISA